MINLTTAPHKQPKREYAHDEEAGMVPEQPVFDFEIITCHQSRFAPASNALPCFWHPGIPQSILALVRDEGNIH